MISLASKAQMTEMTVSSHYFSSFKLEIKKSGQPGCANIPIDRRSRRSFLQVQPRLLFLA